MMPGQLQDSLFSHRHSLMMGQSGVAASTRSRLSLMPGQLPSRASSSSQLRSPKGTKRSSSTLSVLQTSPEVGFISSSCKRNKAHKLGICIVYFNGNKGNQKDYSSLSSSKMKCLCNFNFIDFTPWCSVCLCPTFVFISLSQKKVKASCFPRPLTPKNKNVYSGQLQSALNPVSAMNAHIHTQCDSIIRVTVEHNCIFSCNNVTCVILSG